MQQYVVMGSIGGADLYRCGGCGCAVFDTDQHDLFHTKTRSTV